MSSEVVEAKNDDSVNENNQVWNSNIEVKLC